VSALVPVLAALAVTPLLCLAYATVAELFHPILRRRSLAVPPSWPAVSILHLSDVHVRAGADRLFNAQQALLRGLEPDLVVVTGDLCETVDDVKRTIELLSAVRPRFGTFVVLGNHEHGARRPHSAAFTSAPMWSRMLNRVLEGVAPDPQQQPGQGFAIARRLTDVGIHVLVNRGVRREGRGGALSIAGSGLARLFPGSFGQAAANKRF
jgi:Calcineurin-like phosphoesterase